MAERLRLLIEEKIYKLQNDLDKKKIEAKTMAEFAVVFYEKYEENYNEQLLIQICKRTMNFYNEALKNLPDEKKEFILGKITNGINKAQEKLKNLLGTDNRSSENNFETKDFDLELMENKYKFLVKELEDLGEKKPFFRRKSWKNNLERISQQLDRVKQEIEGYREREKNSDKNRELKSSFNTLVEDLKEFSLEVNPEIALELTQAIYEDIMINENILRSFIYEMVIANLYKYFMSKA